MNLIRQAYESLSKVKTNLRLTFLTIIIFFVSALLENLVYPFSYLIDFGINQIDEFSRFFDYDSLFSIFALLAIYILASSLKFPEKSEREKYLSTGIFCIFFAHYVFTFHFMERLLSLYPPSLNQLPKTFTDFFPFDWVSLGFDFRTINDGYAGWREYLSITINSITAISFFIAVFFFIRHLKSSHSKISIKVFFQPLKQEFLKKKHIAFTIFLTVPFLFINSLSVQAFDFRVLTYEAEFAQEKLVEFSKQISDADNLFFSERENARKAAADRAFTEIAERDNRFQSVSNSLLSNNLEDLKVGLIELMILWQELLQQVALKSDGNDELVFKISQKYKELSKIALSNSPSLVEDYNIDFWENEFLSLVK